MSTKTWFPLESNPELMNSYAGKLGIGADSAYEYVDVFGLDDELLELVPRPVVGVMLLFPLTKENQELQSKEDAESEKQKDTFPKDLFFMKQTIGNACGTVAIVHSLANNAALLNIDKDSFLKDFLDASQGKTPDQIAQALEKDNRVEEAHASSALSTQNSSAVVEDTNLHFVCFVEKEGKVFELDGRRNYPCYRGESSGDLLKDVVKVVRNYMQLNPEQLYFNLVALAKKP
ncbi:hypothetical protein C9374_004506 [Naegleria lovaniensis]|uniref:Ubiquitin carboxyl-terminal hydrolase n=1 Tax=Naegleria lovaniensis TaxID=51637 RepID=A0AA88GQ90_NAELO|nr:uncharacterized protein C9374_004506 [Naegleria lovaniensis]KAG2383169.1 hypothetical protein C9374_004506 [Naegleria lovaniensis]